MLLAINRYHYSQVYLYIHQTTPLTCRVTEYGMPVLINVFLVSRIFLACPKCFLYYVHEVSMVTKHKYIYKNAVYSNFIASREKEYFLFASCRKKI